MNRRQLGNTSLEIPVIGIGTWQYNSGIQPIQAGLALGAALIDTAESYGSEEIVGQAIQGSRRDVFLATKVSPRHFRYENVVRSAEASLKRLKTDYLDLYQLHWPNYTIPIEETMAAIETLVDAGKVRFIGVSNFMLPDLKKAQRAMKKHPIVSNQVRYSLIDRTIENDLLEYCQKQDITVIAYSPLATGLAQIQAMDPGRVLERLARIHSRTVAQIALSWCISKKCVVTIPKTSSVAHVRENCAASDFQLPAEELELLDRSVRYRRRNGFEIRLRRIARHTLQVVGRNQ